ncbi:MAG: glycosyltransferase [Anaerolineaceae bacterium]|nr:glycosyltransferase [Anaerolineaceae bacterium]
MHITIFVYGSWGDIRPHVVLGMALQAAGHEVQVVASRGYEAWVRARHLGFYPLTTDVNTFAKEHASIMDANPLQQMQIARKLLNPIFTQMALEVLDATRESDVLMTVEFGVGLLFDILRVNKLKTILINPAPLNPTREFVTAASPAPDWFPFKDWYNRLSYTLIRRITWMILAGPRNEVAVKHLGLPKSKFKDFQAMLAVTPALTTVSRHVVQRPADWDERFQITGYLFDDDPQWTPAQALVDFLAAGDAPVYIGFGSMPDSQPEATTRLLIDAVKQSGKRAVILTGWAGLGTDDVPDSIHILKYAPHSWLFPQMAAVVHHGGSGTTASGLRAGVPTIIVPHNADQPYWGRMVKQLGVGTEPIPRKKLTADKLAAAIRAVTSDPIMREKAVELGKKVSAEDGIREAVKVIRTILEENQPSN